MKTFRHQSTWHDSIINYFATIWLLHQVIIFPVLSSTSGQSYRLLLFWTVHKTVFEVGDNAKIRLHLFTPIISRSVPSPSLSQGFQPLIFLPCFTNTTWHALSCSTNCKKKNIVELHLSSFPRGSPHFSLTVWITMCSTNFYFNFDLIHYILCTRCGGAEGEQAACRRNNSVQEKHLVVVGF